MDAQLLSFVILLSLIWFLLYWVLGGVFFSVIAIARLGRVRKLRFSCLFSLLSLVLGVGAAYIGIAMSETAVSECLDEAVGNTERVVALFGCGFASILGTFLLGAFVLTVGGFLIMMISRSKAKPWIVLEPEQPKNPVQDQSRGKGSQFF